ncbi:MAG: DUF4982 domain-containing protein [Tannerella sp.]|jgi:beta-galactosidase|nr:DUF4982 domain-containing protein [Tannerella sp.]
MRKTLVFTVLLLIASCLTGYSKAPERLRESFDFDWKFILQDEKSALNAEYDDSGWDEVQLPHDWSIGLLPDSTKGASNGFYPGGIGWYRKTFIAPQTWKGQHVSILFDGVYHRSDVYINGRHLGFYAYGYIGFEYDITPYLQYGKENVIAVRVDHSDCPSSRWYSGSGIYRHVWLNITNQVHIATWGTYITTPEITDEAATVSVETTVENSDSSIAKIKSLVLQSTIIAPDGKVVATVSTPFTLQANTKQPVTSKLTLSKPRLWSCEEPALYRLVSVVKEGSRVLDRYETPFGVRSFDFDPDKGFFLNGKNMKLQGFCMHHDNGCLGAAVPDRANIRKLQIIKEYGCNAIRCSHNPPTPEFLDACDSLGFLVIGEAFDKWKGGYYAQHFDQAWQKDLGSMLLRDRNHPSIIIWSAGNETSEQGDLSGEGTKRAKMLYDYIRATDPSRPVSVSLATSDDDVEAYNISGFADVFDIVGYNYQEPWYAEDHKNFPKRIILGTETFPFYHGRWGSTKRHYYVRDYFPRNPWYDVIENDYVSGGFIWTGIDYLGETMGWPSKGWVTGLFDVCMFEKPRAAFHRSMWNDEPMVRIAVQDQSLNIDPGKDHWSWPHLAAHWNFPQYKGHIIQVQTTTNCDSVELFINNASFGRRKRTDYTNNTIVWYVPYRAGKILAKGYNDGVEVATYELNTSGKATKVALEADRTDIAADGQDISFITVVLQDEKGITVPDSDRKISFEVSGAGRLLGVDNGDLRSHEPSNGNSHITYFGHAQLIVQSTRQPGFITIKATATGLQSTEIKITTNKRFSF